MDINSRIFVAGHRGMVGSAILRQLQDLGHEHLITRSSSELDLRDQQAVQSFFKQTPIDVVIQAAAKVGGIHANDTYPAEFIHDNLMIQNNVIHAAHEADVDRLLFLGSSCIYPKFANQPMAETELLTGTLEPTNEPYAIAKIAGIKMCESYNRQYGRDYRSVMPTNLYGVGDNFHPVNSHVVPALIRRFHEAVVSGTESVVVWGTGETRREFLYVDDMAAGCLKMLDVDKAALYDVVDERLSHINIGTGVDCTIAELVQTIVDETGFSGEVQWDSDRPAGAPRKLLDTSRIRALGWEPKVSLAEGIHRSYEWFRQNESRS